MKLWKYLQKPVKLLPIIIWGETSHFLMYVFVYKLEENPGRYWDAKTYDFLKTSNFCVLSNEKAEVFHSYSNFQWLNGP